MLNYLLSNFVSIDQDIVSQYHRASERCMAHVRPSLRRLAKEAERKMKVKLTGFSYIRQHDFISHSTQVQDKYKRKFFICLMMGQELYLDEFNPHNPREASFYVLEIEKLTVTVSAAVLSEVFKLIPAGAYDLSDNRCRINKDDFLDGIRAYADLLQQKKSK